MAQAIEVTERQHELIQQKATAIADMQSKLEERLATFRGWLADLESTPSSAPKTKANV